MEIALLDCTLPTLAENLALDEALLLEAEKGTGGEVLRFWEWLSPAVVLGAGGSVDADVHRAACDQDRIQLHRRSSGGGTVLLGEGCLLFSLVLRFDRDPVLRDIHASYRYILDQLIKALEPVAALEQSGISDLAFDGNKCSGNAQQRKRGHILHHGTLLYRFELDQIARYLRMPEKQPEYRRGRRHQEFVANLPSNLDQLKRLIALEWSAADFLPQLPMKEVNELVAGKYSQREWVYRSSIKSLKIN